MFVPKTHWKPEHMRGTVILRDCYWCGETRRKKGMTSIKEGPVIWHFCNIQCASKWAKNRLKREWRKYLRLTPYERMNLPISQLPLEDGLVRTTEQEQ